MCWRVCESVCEYVCECVYVKERERERERGRKYKFCSLIFYESRRRTREKVEFKIFNF